MHVELVVNGQRVVAMVDNGAAHNFVTGREATRVGHKLSKDDSKLKVVTRQSKRSMAWLKMYHFS